MKIGIINGPNLNSLGYRETNIYGKNSLFDLEKILKEKFNNVAFLFYQSNNEGLIIDKIYEFSNSCNALIINPGAFSHYSVAIYDAIKAISIPVIEVHISNIFKRECFRQNLLTASATKGLIIGFGIYSYVIAVYAILNSFIKD